MTSNASKLESAATLSPELPAISQDSYHRLIQGIESIMDYAIFMLDPVGNVMTWNEGAKRIKGYTASEIIGKHFSIFYPEEAKSINYTDYELEYAKANGRFEEEGWRVRKDGSLFWASVVITPIYNEEKTLVGFSKITRDLTERKNMIDELKKAKNSAESLNKELEAFSYSVSHDLRAPLRSIDGYTRLILEEKGEQLDAEAKEYLEKVCSNAQQMGQLIDDLLKLSRLSRTPLNKEKVNLSRLAKELLSNLQEQEPERKVEVQIQDRLTALVDPVLMRCGLQNMLGNAWKFTHDKENAMIEFGSTRKNGQTVYFIRDNGAGFNMKYADKLFGAFQRLHDATEFPGTGIGLTTVQRIIHRHGGEIWAEGTENQGATFYFTV